MNTKLRKILSVIAVTMFVMTIFVAIDPAEIKNSSAEIQNADTPTVVSPAVIDGSTASGPLWAGYPNVVYDADTNKLTFTNANIEVTAGSTMQTAHGIYCSLYSLQIVLEGENNIIYNVQTDSRRGAESSAIYINSGDLVISGNSTTDTLNIKLRDAGWAAGNSLLMTGITCSDGRLEIKDCTINISVLKEKSVSSVPDVGFIAIYQYCSSSTVFICNNVKINISLAKDLTNSYTTYTINNGSNCKYTNTTITMEDPTKLTDAAANVFFNQNGGDIEFEHCKLKIKMKSNLFTGTSVKFSDFYSLTLYPSDDGSPTVIKDVDEYQLESKNYKQIELYAEYEPTANEDVGPYLIAFVTIPFIPFVIFLFIAFRNREDDD